MLLLLPFLGANAAENPLWMRYPKISPDGKMIAFSYKGDIYVVASTGGEAKRITTWNSYEYQPMWSNDGKTLAFSSNRFGGMDIFTIPAAGGSAKRITTHSTAETPLAFSPDDKHIYFSAAIQKPASSAQWTNAAWMEELYKVSVNGGRPYQIVSSPVCSISFDTDGASFLYYNRTGGENIWRKHHVSSVARDIYYYDNAKKEHRQLTTNPGEDRDPIFISKDRMVFLSERNGGSFNVYESAINDTEHAKALTNFKKHPVRFLSRANDGTLCFGFQGEIYTLAGNGTPKKVSVSIVNDTKEDTELLNLTSVEDMDISANGKEVVFISRGEVFATTDKYATTNQITHTAAAEQGVTVSPDGQTIIYASERTGTWTLFKAEKARKEDLHFANATVIKEEPLFKDNTIERSAPLFSPDGKELAYIENRNILKVLNLETNKVRTITDGSQHHSSDPYGFDFQWSPDGKWFAVTFVTNKRAPYNDIGIVSAVNGGKIYNVTNSGYIDRSPRWVLGGNAIIYASDRLGMRSHASWGSQNDIFIAFMNYETAEKFNMSEEEYELSKESVKENKDEKNKDIVIDFDGIPERIQRLTPMSSRLGSAVLSEDGETLYFTSAFEKGYDLWKLDIRKRNIAILKKGIASGSMVLDKSKKNIYILGSRPQVVTMANGQSKPISFNAKMELDHAAEREYMFNHVFTQEEKKFYNSNYHGVNLKQLKEDYKPFLAHINNNYDFSEMLSEILGELNVSHTGSKHTGLKAEKMTPELGLLFDLKYTGDGLKIAEVLQNGPFSATKSKVAAGTILEKIDNIVIKAGEDYFPLINGKEGKATLFSFRNPATGERWDEVAKPISRSAQSNILYERWIKDKEAQVEKLSGGRLGYVHIRSMNDDSFRDVFSDVLGKYLSKEGIVIDTRFNGGGRLHEDVEILFTGEKYLEQVVRGKVYCDMPSRRYNKHSIMVVGEANYSNAHGTPWVYQHQKIGSVVGMPVPGTMTSVNWETLQDRDLVFGIPAIGYRTKEGTYLENSQLEPDFKVKNRPEVIDTGRDEQLEVAVKELLKQIDADKNRW